MFLALLGLSNGQRRKGGGGGNDGGDGDSHDDDSFEDDGGDGGSDLPDNSAPCGWWARQETFGLPGLYYNGTLTVRHRVKENTAWEDEEGELLECDNDDAAPKSYKYPAMVLIAPTGNESDTNPMHWVLKAFQPAHEQSSNRDEVDFLQRWVYIRSSDFVVSNQTLIWDSPYRPYRTDYLAEADATLKEETTRVYWSTNITSSDDNVFSARAEYVETPPLLDPDTYRNKASWSAGLYSSQYITLKDICAYNQELLDDPYDEDIEAVQREAAGQQRRQETRTWEGTNPTYWLPLGAVLEMDNIGAGSMSWEMNATLDKAIPWKGMREAGLCTAFNRDSFEMSDFFPWQSRNNEASHVVPWNTSLSISLQFEGDIVSENSTSLEGQTNGKLAFGEDYKRFIKQEEEEQEDSATSSRVGPCSWIWIALVCLAHASLG